MCKCVEGTCARSASTSAAPACLLGADPGWLDVHGELRDLHVRKSASYGVEGERFHNFVALGVATGKPPERYVWERIMEKAIRALNMIDAGAADRVKEGPDVASLAVIAEAFRRRS